MDEIEQIAIENAARHAAEREKLIAQILANPEAAKTALDKIESEASLVNFIEAHWPILEPGREFKRGWVIDALCDHLESVTDGDILRLLINVPPGFMKSLTLNVFWPAWEWGPKALPWYRYVTAAYSEELTFRDNRKMMQVIQSPEYQANWGHIFSLEKTGEGLCTNNRTGFSRATSVSGVGTGERGDRFKVDDPHNIKDTESEAKRDSTLMWFSESVPTRINDPNTSAIIVIMQRVHSQDVSGLILEKELNFTHLMIPMEFEPDRKCTTYVKGVKKFEDPRTVEGELAFPERYSQEFLDTTMKPMMRAQGGMYAEEAQLQQRPSPRGGGMFKRAFFADKIIPAIPPTDTIVKRSRGWDLAGSKQKRSAQTASVRLAKGRSGAIYVEHVLAFRGTPMEVEMKVGSVAIADRAANAHVKIVMPQDPAQAGKAQVNQYAKGVLQGFDFTFVREVAIGDKVYRANPLAAQCEFGNVYLIKGEWNEDFMAELADFPTGRYRDRVDAASLAYLHLSGQIRESMPAAPVLILPEADPEDTGY